MTARVMNYVSSLLVSYNLKDILFLRDISRFMRERNILGSSKGYVQRVLSSYEAVKIDKIQKYFLSTVKYAQLYLEGETALTVNEKMKELRKTHRVHRRANDFREDYNKNSYVRNRLFTL